MVFIISILAFYILVMIAIRERIQREKREDKDKKINVNYIFIISLFLSGLTFLFYGPVIAMLALPLSPVTVYLVIKLIKSFKKK